jgi:hypothetical protein
MRITSLQITYGLEHGTSFGDANPPRNGRFLHFAAVTMSHLPGSSSVL